MLGWSQPGGGKRPMGFGAASPDPVWQPEAVRGAVTDHHLVVGSTGTGKTRSVVIPNVLDHDGPLIVVDIKGEIFRTTERHLKRLGRTVVLIDPFAMLAAHPANGLDLLQPVVESDDPAAAAQSIVEMLSPSDVGRDPFWPLCGNALVAATLHYAAFNREKGRGPPHTVSDCIDFLHAEDVNYGIAVVLDTVGDLPEEVRRAFGSLLQMPDVTRGGVLATAQAPLKVLAGRGLRAAFSGLDLDLGAVTRGDDLAVFIAWPPWALQSHAAALRLLLSVLLDAIFGRTAPPARTTLLMVDEAGTIGRVPQIEQAFTLSRGYGCRVTAVFQSMHQLDACYGAAARTIVDNAGVISVFPPPNLRSARETADMLGVPAATLADMDQDQVLVSHRGRSPRFLRRADGLTDPAYRGMCDTPGDMAPTARRVSSDGRGRGGAQ